MSKKRRTKIEIINDMLEVMGQTAGGVNKTKIVYGANLNFERASRFLKWLIEKELVMAFCIQYEQDTNASEVKYTITYKGEEILRQILKLGDEMRSRQ